MLIVANWKANKTLEESLSWINNFTLNTSTNKEIVIAAPFPYILTIKDKLFELQKNISLASQNISIYPNGPYTGEVTAIMIRNTVKYCIVGHSERRKLLNETVSDVEKKCTELLKNNIKPIICAASFEELPKNLQSFEENSFVLAFEPTEAISVNGVYQNYDYQKADQIMSSWKKELDKEVEILFGGSINKDNIGTISKITASNGFLIGNASLDPVVFTEIINSLIY